MGELVKLPTRTIGKIELENVQIEGPPMNMDECEGVIHVFAEVPGRCQCGTETWNELNESTATIGIHEVR